MLQPTEIENLTVLGAGSNPVNPGALLRSPEFEALLTELDERADLVIFDSPPCIAVTDPLVVAGHMDGVMLVVHVGETRRDAIVYAADLLSRARARKRPVSPNRLKKPGAKSSSSRLS